MRRHYFILTLALLVALSSFGLAQDLKVFGFFQGRIQAVDGLFSLDADVPTPMGTVRMNLDKLEEEQISFNIQQLNLFFRNELSDDFTAWLNFELTNSFNTMNNWGTFSLEEAWVQYYYNKYFAVKGGLLIPRFNYLNEVKNRMPLLPYVIRPLIYEASLASTINMTDYLPERAFLQVYGDIPTGSVNFDYAVYIGHAEKDYILEENHEGSRAAGIDTAKFKLIGGRVGIKYGNLRFGLSATYDKDNHRATLNEDVPRYRIGGDVSFTYKDAFVDAEFIQVQLKPKADVPNMDKLFYYATLGYNITDKIFAYGSYSYIEDEERDFLKTGMQSYLVGAGYRPIYSVVLKGQWNTYFTDGTLPIPMIPGQPPVDADVKLDFKAFSFALSVMF